MYGELKVIRKQSTSSGKPDICLEISNASDTPQTQVWHISTEYNSSPAPQ